MGLFQTFPTDTITIILPCPDNRDIDKDIKKISDNRYRMINRSFPPDISILTFKICLITDASDGVALILTAGGFG